MSTPSQSSTITPEAIALVAQLVSSAQRLQRVKLLIQTGIAQGLITGEHQALLQAVVTEIEQDIKTVLSEMEQAAGTGKTPRK